MIEKKTADSTPTTGFLQETATIVAAYVSRNSLAMGDVSKLLQEVHSSLAALDSDANGPGRLQPAVSIKKSVTPDHIICLEDGKKLKMLKRYLKTAHDMTPAEYRERWGLPADYPMVAPNYAKRRSELAREIGLGTRANRRRGA